MALYVVCDYKRTTSKRPDRAPVPKDPTRPSTPSYLPPPSARLEPADSPTAPLDLGSSYRLHLA